MDKDEAFACPICLEPFIDPFTVVPCGHSACFHCLKQWLDRGNTRCPACTNVVTHAVLSFSLRNATHAVLGSAVTARRKALRLEDTDTSKMSIVVAQQFSAQRVYDQLLGDADGNENRQWLVGIAAGASGAIFAACFSIPQISSLTTLTVAVSIITSIGILRLDLVARIQLLLLEQAADGNIGAAALAAEGAPPPRAPRPAFHVLWWRQLCQLVRVHQLWIFLASSWLLLFFLFWALLLSRMQAHEQSDLEKDLLQLARALLELGSSSLPRILAHVFVVAFVVVFALLYAGQAVMRGVAQLRR